MDNNMYGNNILAGTYEILGEIGSGGGGIVYKARHLRLNTYVVVKKIRSQVQSTLNIRQEADILKNLKHPYLPRVYDFIEAPDGVYTVIDYIDGENLNDAVKRYGRFDQRQVLKWANQLGEALAYLHSQNPPIIHSDIKPANIMLTRDGNICLIDFNISLAMGENAAVGISAGFSPPEQYRDPAIYQRVSENSGHTQTSMVTRSTSQYERYFGKGIDKRSDIYSLGMTLYYTLTGQKPDMNFDNIVPIEDNNIYISEGFAAIIDKMIEITPQKRYADGTQFLNAIRNCHKLDARYVAMHRNQVILSFEAFIFLIIGIVTIIFGITRLGREENSDYYNFLALATEEIELENYDEASDYIEEAKEVSTLKIDAYEQEVYILYLSEQYDECIDTGEKYIKTAPFDVYTDADRKLLGDIYYIVGNAYYENGDYANARAMFEDAFEYNDETPAYYRDYAIALAKLGKLDKARDALKQAKDLGIEKASVNMVEGELAYMEGDYPTAADYLEKVVDTTDDRQMKKRAVFLCVEAYRAQGNDGIDSEISLLEDAAVDFGSSFTIQEYLGDAYVRKAYADPDNEVAYYNKALSMFGAIYEDGYVTYQLLENMAIIYENMDDFDNAQQMLEEMMDLYPDNYAVYKRYAFLEADRQQSKENSDRDYTKMKQYYETALEKYPSDGDDAEMDMLANMMRDLESGGWF